MENKLLQNMTNNDLHKFLLKYTLSVHILEKDSDKIALMVSDSKGTHLKDIGDAHRFPVEFLLKSGSTTLVRKGTTKLVDTLQKAYSCLFLDRYM